MEALGSKELAVVNLALASQIFGLLLFIGGIVALVESLE